MSDQRGWNIDPDAGFTGRLGNPAWQTPINVDGSGGPISTGNAGCPDLIEMTTGDVYVVARTAPDSVVDRLPGDVTVRHDEVAGVIPAAMFAAAATAYLARHPQPGHTDA